ncbi:MAG TPA: PAS domain S-box protein, partial [Vitreimonas sp.]|nr:PAS domain S-box protein [Vitreimonas sp.]
MIEHLDQPRDPTAPPSLFPAILDAVADGITVQDSGGRVIYANEAALRMIGFDRLPDLLDAEPEEILSRFELIDHAGRPLSPANLPGRLALRGDDAGPVVVGYRVVATGELSWSQVRATPLRDAEGRITHAINTFHDITDRMRIEADLRASEASYRQLVEAMPQIAWATDASGRILMVNERWREYAGEERPPGSGLGTDDGVHEQDKLELERRWAACLSSGEPLEMTARIRRRDGVYRWHLVRAVPVRRSDDDVGGWIGTSTDIDDERRSRAAASLLAAAAERLDETLDPEDTAAAAAAIAVPVLGDWCVLERLEQDGTFRRSAVHGEGWAPEDVARVRAEATDSNGDGPVAQAVREGRSIVTDAVDRHSPAAHTTLVVPLLARGRPLGAMVLGLRRPERRYEAGDVLLAEDLARRVALALSNAALYAGEQSARAVAEATAARMETLQLMTRTLAHASSADEVASIATRDAAPALGAVAAALA